MEHRKRFKAGIERLENRELMAGDLNFDPQTGALSIIGTRAGIKSACWSSAPMT